MKLRSRTKVPIDNNNNSSTVTATVPVLPPNITRLQTPPISELSNAGSTIAKNERLSELSSSIADISDTEETIDSVSPTKNRPRPTITVPAAPLTKRNLTKYQEEITSAVEIATEDERSLSPASLNTRLVQARNFLLAENTNSYPGFANRLEQIEEYLRTISIEKAKLHSSIYNEVKRLLRSHRIHIFAGVEPPVQRRPTITTTVEDASRPVISLPAADDQDPDPFEWTNKLDDLTHRVRQTPSGGKEAYAFTNLRELARPLNAGRLPSLEDACRLINEQMIRENHENKSSNDINHDQLSAFENNLPSASKEKKSSLDRWSGRRPEGEGAAKLRLGEGTIMPQEMMDYDWDRDRVRLEESGVGYYEDVDEGDAQLLFAETPLLQAAMSEQIESDLAAGVEKGKEKGGSVARKQPVLMTQKFALPRPPRSRIDEAMEIAKSLDIQLDPPTPSPRTALFRKRKFEQCSDSETEDEEGGGRWSERPVGGAGDMKGEDVFVNETVGSLDSLFDGSVVGYPEMSGALQGLEGGGDDLHLYSDD